MAKEETVVVDGKRLKRVEYTCPTCGGDKYVYGGKCPECKGNGSVSYWTDAS